LKAISLTASVFLAKGRCLVAFWRESLDLINKALRGCDDLLRATDQISSGSAFFVFGASRDAVIERAKLFLAMPFSIGGHVIYLESKDFR